MTLVNVTHRPGVALTLDLAKFGAFLRDIFADALYCKDPGGDLVAADIEVHFHLGETDDATDFDLLVDVEAKNFPSREENLETITGQAGEEIDLYLPDNVSCGLWLKLVQAGWASRQAKAA